MIPARSQLRSSFNSARSQTRRSIRTISASWSISSKQLLMSASSTQCAPPFALWRMTSSASWADRFGRKPKLAGLKSASKIGSRTSLAALMSTRSRRLGMPSGLVCPGLPAFGIFTRRRG